MKAHAQTADDEGVPGAAATHPRSSSKEFELSVARMVCVGFNGPRMNDHLRELLHRGVSAVSLFSRNYESHPQLRSLCREIKSVADRPVMICVDHEGGRVQRFGPPFTMLPSMRKLGAAGDAERARDFGRIQARELRAVSIDMNLAPVLDVDSNPLNPVIGERSFGSDPRLVIRMSSAMIDGLQNSPECVAACGKHFPGHGDTVVDSHLDLPRLAHPLDRLHKIELPPFAAAIKQGIAAIMTAHVIFEAIDPQRPATMSKAVIGDLLRKELEFEGVILSDDLEMRAITDHFGIEAAAVQAVDAGADLLLVCHEARQQHAAIDAIIRAVRHRDLRREKIARANQRLNALFSRFVKPPPALEP